jgi:hypothetical protein
MEPKVFSKYPGGQPRSSEVVAAVVGCTITNTKREKGTAYFFYREERKSTLSLFLHLEQESQNGRLIVRRALATGPVRY